MAALMPETLAVRSSPAASTAMQPPEVPVLAGAEVHDEADGEDQSEREGTPAMLGWLASPTARELPPRLPLTVATLGRRMCSCDCSTATNADTDAPMT